MEKREDGVEEAVVVEEREEIKEDRVMGGNISFPFKKKVKCNTSYRQDWNFISVVDFPTLRD